MTNEIRVEARYGHPSVGPLAAIFEANLDFDSVAVSRSELAVKAHIPFQLLIDAVTVYSLERFVLQPLIDPIAPKFDWAAGVRRFLAPHWPFRLVIRVSEEHLEIEADLETQHAITEHIWATIRDVLTILQTENRRSDVEVIKIFPDKSGQPLVICYSTGRPVRKVVLGERRTIEIVSGGGAA